MKITFIKGEFWNQEERIFYYFDAGETIVAKGLYVTKGGKVFRLKPRQKPKKLEEREIVVVKQSNPFQTLKTLLHEILHYFVDSLPERYKEKLHNKIDKCLR